MFNSDTQGVVIIKRICRPTFVIAAMILTIAIASAFTLAYSGEKELPVGAPSDNISLNQSETMQKISTVPNESAVTEAPIVNDTAYTSVDLGTAPTALVTEIAGPDFTELIPKKYEDALQELKELLLAQDTAYRQPKTDYGAVDYAQYAEVEIDTAARELIGDVAYLDLGAAPDSLHTTILQARDIIVHSATGWAVMPDHIFEINLETGERFFFPKFSDVFPGWDVPSTYSATGQEIIEKSYGFNRLPEGFVYVTYYESAEKLALS